MTHVSTCIFQGLFKNIVFRSVALVTTKLWAILDFFRDQTFFRPYPPLKIIKKMLNPFNYYSLKVTKFYGGSVKNESARI